MSSKIWKPRSPCDAEISCDWILVLASSDSLELNLKRFWSSAASAVLTKSRVIRCQHVHWTWCSPLPEFILHCLFIVCYPNRTFYAKYFSSVLSPSMTRSSAVMLSPHQWSMPCSILSHPPIFCFCSPASTTDIMSRNVCCLKFWNHGWTGGSKKGPEY